MKMLTLFCILFLLANGWLILAAAYTPETSEPTPLEKEAFAILKKKFPGRILDENLKTVHAFAESPEYQNFLTEAYSATKPIQGFEKIVNFEATLNKILPPKEHYLTFYTEQFRVEKVEEVEDVEHFLIHHEATRTWVHHAIKIGDDKPISKRIGGLRLPSSAKFMNTPPYRKMLETRFGISAKLEMSPNMMTEIVRYVNMPVIAMTKSHLVADADRIKKCLEKNGNSDGMLWLAIQYPVLFERIRYTFTTDTTFINYVHTAPITAEAEAQRIQELKKRLQQQQKEQPNQ